MLIALSVVTGAPASTYVVVGTSGPSAPRAGFGSGLIGWFAVGCPVCNKLVVALLGVSRATSKFEPAQRFLGAFAVALAVTVLAVRLRAIRRGACPLPRRAAAERT